MTVTEQTRPRRPGAAMADMARSLGLVALAVGVTLLFVPGLLHPSKSQRFPAVNYLDDLGGFAQLAGVPVLTPTALPHGWTATSATVTGDRQTAHLHVGWAVPGNRYAGLEESVAPATRFIPALLGARATSATGAVIISGALWQRRTASNGEPALSRTAGRVTVVVTGSATDAQLTALAASLQ